MRRSAPQWADRALSNRRSHPTSRPAAGGPPLSANGHHPVGDEDEIDADVVKTVFSCLQAGLDFDRQALIAEVSNSDAARAMRMVTGDRIRTVNSAEILSLVLAQGVRDQGMGQVFQQLMSYAGVEVYFSPVPDDRALATFGDLVIGATNVVPIGLRRGDHVEVLPSLHRRLVPVRRWRS